MKNLEYKKSFSINAPAEVVFKIFTNPADIRHWYDAVAQLALRSGGHFTYADSTGDVYESGEFIEVKPNELLRYKMEHHGFYKGTEVSISFKEAASQKTELTFVHANLSESDLDYAGASWDWALRNLKNYVEEGSTQTFKAWFSANKQNYKI